MDNVKNIENILEDMTENGTGDIHSLLKSLEKLSNNADFMNSMPSENKQLKLSEINMKSLKHSPSVDNQKIKLDRVINSLIPELEELESDL